MVFLCSFSVRQRAWEPKKVAGRRSLGDEAAGNDAGPAIRARRQAAAKERGPRGRGRRRGSKEASAFSAAFICERFRKMQQGGGGQRRSGRLRRRKRQGKGAAAKAAEDVKRAARHGKPCSCECGEGGQRSLRRGKQGVTAKRAAELKRIEGNEARARRERTRGREPRG